LGECGDLSSTLYINRLITDRRKQVFDVHRADKPQISRHRICLKKELLPEPPAHDRQDVMKGRVYFRISGGLRQWQVAGRVQGLGQQDNQREEAQECRRGAFNGQIAPLALGLQTEMGAGLFKGHF
jgi:hypothetical protein